MTSFLERSILGEILPNGVGNFLLMYIKAENLVHTHSR